MESEKLFAVLLCYLVSSCYASVITFEDNEYKGITIVIHNSVDEDSTIVENLKTMLTAASDALYKATRNRAYFGEVTIVVPPEWSQRQEYEKVPGGSRFANANVRIDHPNPMFGNNPYTLQPGGCGDPGHYIHLTPQFVRELNGFTTEEYGDPGKTFVHEWAHLRYGVFDEYGDENDYRTPPYYLDENNQIRPTGCMSNLKGWIENEQHQRCKTKDGLPDENCEFYPDANSYEEARGSLMYMHWLPSVEGFCGDSEELQHNFMAPNTQNLLCKGQSTWAVVSTHSDFTNRNPPRPNIDTRPKFRVLQPQKNEQGNYLLVLDISGSMSGRRINMLHRSASRFIQDQVPDNSRLGIVVFSTVPQILADMMLITNESRKVLLTRLPTQDDEGNTAIGLGLQAGLEVLKMNGPTEGAVIILISDGEENIAPNIAEVIDEILEAKVTIHTVAFGSMASQHLEKLVRLTGGRGFFYSDDEILHSQAAVLQAAFFAAASTQADVELQPVEVVNRVIFLKPRGEKSGSLIVDKAIGKNTRFTFTYNFTGELLISLTSPVGVVYTETSKEYRNDALTRSIFFVIPSARSGKWTYNITNNNQLKQGIGISVTAEVRDVKQQPVRIRSWLSDVEFHYPHQAGQAKIFAEVKKQYVPVINAKVLAIVERPDGKHVQVELHDNGAGADIKKDDGIYSAYFTQFSGNGRYSVSAEVVNDGNAKLRLKKKKQQGVHLVMKRPANINPDKQAQYSFTSSDLDPSSTEELNEFIELPVDEFERSLLAGSFRLQDWRKGDFIPPNRVIDLQVNGMSRQEESVSLFWTSPGDDMESGRASRLEIRYHTKAKFIWEKFNETFEVKEEDVIHGTLVPEFSGNVQNITIRINTSRDRIEGTTFFFALRCYDDEENVAEVSNVALAYLVVEEPEMHQIIPASQITLIIVGAVVALLLLAIASIVIYRSQQKHQRWGGKVYVK